MEQKKIQPEEEKVSQPGHRFDSDEFQASDSESTGSQIGRQGVGNTAKGNPTGQNEGLSGVATPPTTPVH